MFLYPKLSPNNNPYLDDTSRIINLEKTSPVPTCMINYWDFQDNSNDSVGGLIGTDSNIVSGNQYGYYHKGVHFNSSLSRITYTDTSLLDYNNWTISFWIRYYSGRNIISRRSDYQYDWEIVYEDGIGVMMYFKYGFVFNQQPSVTLDSNWHNITITRNGDTYIIYKDAYTGLFNNGTYENGTASVYPLVFGNPTGALQNIGAVMDLDNVCVFNCTLNQTQITDLCFNTDWQ